MKQFLYFFMFIFCFSLSAKQIDVKTASAVAESFIKESSSLKQRKVLSLNLVYTSTSKAKSFRSSHAFYYVFNIGNNEGFIIISADDVNTPILGYSKTGSYDPENLPDNFKSWMNTIALGMEEAIAKGVIPTKEIQTEWENFRIRKTIYSGTYKKIVVEPLIKTKWNQDAPYNSQIPYKGLYTGCVATATAQIMNYYKYPKSGTGITKAYTVSADNTTYSIPAIDLSKYTYDWANMLNTYNSTSPGNAAQKKAVGQLMYHIGASIKMSYSKLGSGAYSADAARSLFTYFNYDKSLELRSRYDYLNDVNNSWDAMLRNELNNKRPVYFSGSGNGAHAFICDGYDDQGFFHFNWGWGGYSDGYFKTTAPLDYKEGQSVIINIKPNAGGIGAPKLELKKDYPSISAEITSGKKGTKFSTKFSFQNVSLFDFEGYYGVALTDDKDNIQYILDQSNLSKLSSGYFYTVYNFANCVIPLDAKSGKYKLRLVAKSKGQSNWFIVTSPSVTVVKYIPFQILDGSVPAKLQILSDTPLSVDKNSVKAGETVSVKLSFVNFSGILFKGYYGIALTDNTNAIKYILSQSGLSQLGTNSYYPVYNFYNCMVPSGAIPGNYKLKMVYRAESNTNWTVANAISSSVTDQLSFTIMASNKLKMVSNQVNIYPNPVTDKLYIESSAKVTQVILYNMTGKIVAQASVSELSNQAIELGDLSPGMYIAHIYTEQGKTIHNVLKK